MQDVAANPKALLDAGDAKALVEEVVRRPGAATSVRVGLLVALAGPGWIEPEPEWRRLLETTRGDDRRQVIRAAGRQPGASIEAALIALLAADPDTAEAAALALAGPAHAAAVPALAKTLDHAEPRVARAAVRALGRIGTAEALAALRAAAERGPDDDIGRRAAGELRRAAH